MVAALETALAYARPAAAARWSSCWGRCWSWERRVARLHAFVAGELMSFLPAPALVAAVGEFVPAFEALPRGLGDRLIMAPDAEALGPLLKAALRGDEIVLLKASRGVALERVACATFT